MAPKLKKLSSQNMQLDKIVLAAHCSKAQQAQQQEAVHSLQVNKFPPKVGAPLTLKRALNLI